LGVWVVWGGLGSLSPPFSRLRAQDPPRQKVRSHDAPSPIVPPTPNPPQRLSSLSVTVASSSAFITSYFSFQSGTSPNRVEKRVSRRRRPPPRCSYRTVRPKPLEIRPLNGYWTSPCRLPLPKDPPPMYLFVLFRMILAPFRRHPGGKSKVFSQTVLQAVTFEIPQGSLSPQPSPSLLPPTNF